MFVYVCALIYMYIFVYQYVYVYLYIYNLYKYMHMYGFFVEDIRFALEHDIDMIFLRVRRAKDLLSVKKMLEGETIPPKVYICIYICVYVYICVDIYMLIMTSTDRKAIFLL